MKINVKNVLISAALAGFLIGCGSSDSTPAQTPSKEKPSDQNSSTNNISLKKVNFENISKIDLKSQSAKLAEDGYAEAGDTKVVWADGDENVIIGATKWHNTLSVINKDGKTLTKLNPFAVLKGAGHDTVDAASGASETAINKIAQTKNGTFISVSIDEEELPHNEAQLGIHQVKFNEDGNISTVVKTENKSFSDFVVNKKGDRLIAYDDDEGQMYIYINGNFTAKFIAAPLNLVTWNYTDDENQEYPIIVSKKGNAINLTDDERQANVIATLDFEPTFVDKIDNDNILLVKQEANKPIKLYVANKTKKALDNGTEIPQVMSGKLKYDVSPNGRYLAVGGYNTLSIIELYSGKMNVIKTFEKTDAHESVKFTTDNQIVYSNTSEVGTVNFTETDEKMSVSDLIADKLGQINECTINNCFSFNEVRKDMNLTEQTILGALKVSYEPSAELSNIIAKDGTFTQPDQSVEGKIKVIGKLGNDEGYKEITINIIGKDIKDTIAIDDENMINANVFGDKIVVATEKGFRSYKIDGTKLTPIGDLVTLNDLSGIAPYGTFTNTIVHKINDNTLVGLGVSNVVEVKTKHKGKDRIVKSNEYKIFRATVKADGTVDSNIQTIDVGTSDIANIDVSGDKKTLGIIFTPNPKYIDDAQNNGYKKQNTANGSAMLYDLETNTTKLAKFDLTREESDSHPEELISLNNDASKFLVSESHHGVMKVYEGNVKQKTYSDPSVTGALNHMSSNFLAGNYVIGTPFKGTGIGYIDITDNTNALKNTPYDGGKGWYNKAIVDANNITFATSSRYKGATPGIAVFNLENKTLTLESYKVFNDKVMVDYMDVDFIGENNVILTGTSNGSGYINIQTKK